jgi:hypothetical protein
MLTCRFIEPLVEPCGVLFQRIEARQDLIAQYVVLTATVCFQG